MTPEELAVVQAAMAYRNVVLANPHLLRRLDNTGNKLTPALSELSRATYLLATSCPQCNAGGHTCLRDGNPIPHGASDCGEHDEAKIKHAGADGACPDYGSRLDPCPPGCASGVCVANDPTRCPPAEVEELIFVLRTWEDVRAGDHVRMPGSDATAHVQSAVHLRWHVKPGTGTSQYNPPQPLEWAGVRVTLDNGNSYEMDPAKPIEIEIDAHTASCLERLLFTWAERIGMVIEP